MIRPRTGGRLGFQTAAVLALVCAGGIAWAAPPPARNLLVLTFDTTRADRFPSYGGPVHSPEFDRMAREGVRFERAFAPAPITLPSHVSLFTGLYPAAHGIRSNGSQRLGDDAMTLAEILQANGFRTGAVVGSHVLDSRYGLDQGFDQYDDDLPPEEKLETLFAERPADQVADLGLNWLQERGDERWFLWLHFFDPHWEYRPPEPYAKRHADEPYDGEIAFAADQAGRVLAWLRQKHLLDDTLIVATADHGESLDEHGESSHGIFIYDATMHVPLLFRHPARLGKGRTVSSVASLVDVMPTALEVLAIPPAGEDLQGRSLAPAEQDENRLVWLESWTPRLSYGWSELSAVRGERWKYIRAPRPELYELHSDPGELRDRIDADPDRAEHWSTRLDAAEASIIRQSTPAQERNLDPAERRRLESLGYVSPGRSAPRSTTVDPKDKIAEVEAVQRALELVSREQWESALPGLEKLVAANPESSYLRLHLAGALRRVGRTGEAIGELERCIRLAPDDFGLHTELGSAYLAAGDPDAAVASFRHAVRLNDRLAEAWHNLGLVAQQRGQLDEAAASYERALEADPNLLRSVVNLGALREQAGRTDDAVRLYLRVTQLDPQNIVAYFSAGRLLFEAGRSQEALTVLDDARNADPSSPLPHLYRAQVYQRLGDLDAAEKEVLRALELDPDSQQAAQALSAIQRSSAQSGVLRLMDHTKVPDVQTRSGRETRSAVRAGASSS